jgi:hypothetical protein
VSGEVQLGVLVRMRSVPAVHDGLFDSLSR